MSILDRYFYLSDLASKDSKAFEELCTLFSKDAMILPNGSHEITGDENIRAFFEKFFSTNVETKHFWSTSFDSQISITNWAVSGRRKTGELFALTGKDLAKLNADGKISYLEVKVN